jgi:hypothetical protein
MGFFDLTAVAGPTSGAVLTFAPRLELWATLVGTLAASAIGILAASLRSHRAARAARGLVAVPALRLVAPRADAERA